MKIVIKLQKLKKEDLKKVAELFKEIEAVAMKYAIVDLVDIK